MNLDLNSRYIPNYFENQRNNHSTWKNVYIFKPPDLFIQKLISFVDEIGKGSLKISCTKKHFHYGRRIISREVTNYNESKADLSKKICEDEGIYEEEDEDERNFQYEIKLIDQLFNEEEDANEFENNYDDEDDDEVENNYEGEEEFFENSSNFKKKYYYLK